MNPAEWYVGPARDPAIDGATPALSSTSGITAGGSSKAGYISDLARGAALHHVAMASQHADARR